MGFNKSPSTGAALNKKAVHIQRVMKHPQDLYIPVGLYEIWDSIMTVVENADVLAAMAVINVAQQRELT